VPGLAQHLLDQRFCVLAITIRVAEGTNRATRQCLEPSSVLDELIVSRYLVADRPAENVIARVVRNFTAICRQSGQLFRVEEHPAFGSKPCLINLEPLGQLIRYHKAPAIRHGGD